MKSTISSKGQITVPVEIRDQLGLRPGTAVVFEARSGGAWLRRAPATAAHPVDGVFGSLLSVDGVDAILDALRGSRLAARAPRKTRKK